MKSICIYCGSSTGSLPAFREAAMGLGKLFATRRTTLVYGGGNVGLMGVAADAVLQAGGRVIGVIPRALMDREVGHPGLTEQIVVGSMHERKQRMADLSEGFIALPGGLGTLDELFEMMTWQQLGIHAKPIGLLNVSGYFDGLLRFLDGSVEQGFVRSSHRDQLLVDNDVPRLLERMQEWTTHRSAPVAQTVKP